MPGSDFKQGRYALARLYLKKAIDLSNEASAEMYEHYGDVLAVTGQEAEAVEWWKKLSKPVATRSCCAGKSR